MRIGRFISCRHLLVLFLVSALFFIPAFVLGPGGLDMRCQTLWVEFFSKQFWHGDIYPRWLQDLYAGAGSPVFFYYPPLTYFITAFFAFLAPATPFGYYYPIAASALLGVFISGVTCYLWIKEETDNDSSALIASLLYIAAPFHIAHNFYGVLLFSSLWAHAWIPLLLLFAKRIATSRAYGVTGFAVALALLIMTNLPMTFLCGPLAALYCAIYCRRPSVLRSLLRLGFAAALGFGLSAFYLLPSLSYMHFVNIDWHWNSALEKDWYFFDFDDEISRIFGIYWYVSIALLLVYFLAARPHKGRYFFFIASLIGLIMMLPLSRSLWHSIPFFKTLQMAERLFIIPSIGLVALAAFAAPRLRIFSYGLIFLCLTVTAITAFYSRSSVEKFNAMDPGIYERHQLNIDQYYIYLSSLDLYMRFYTPQGLASVKAHNEQIRVMDGDAVTQVLQWQPRHIAFHYHAAHASALRIRRFDFPGLRAFLAGQELDITRDGESGESIITVPPGEGTVTLELTALLPEIAGKGISILCMAIVCACVLFHVRRVSSSSTPSRPSLM